MESACNKLQYTKTSREKIRITAKKGMKSQKLIDGEYYERERERERDQKPCQLRQKRSV
jgi:hypothetical protein